MRVTITADHRHPDGTGFQSGELDGWHVSREWTRPITGFDPGTCSCTFADLPARPGPWRYHVTGFMGEDAGHVLRVDGTREAVRLRGRRLLVTPRGTTRWTH